MIVGGISVCQIASDRGTVADERVGDDLGCIEQNRIFRSDQIGSLERRFSRSPADLEKATFLLDVLEPGDLADVDEMRGSGNAKLQEGQQTLSSRQHLGVVAMTLE